MIPAVGGGDDIAQNAQRDIHQEKPMQNNRCNYYPYSKELGQVWHVVKSGRLLSRHAWFNMRIHHA